MVSALRQAIRNGELQRVRRPGEVDAMLDQLMQTDWVVYTKAWLKRPATVIDYLGRYSRKIALDDRRIVGIEADRVRLRYKDYQDHDRHKVMTLSGEALIRRFLLHILPQGFVRVRHFGFLANRCQKEKLARIRTDLEQTDVATEGEPDQTERNRSQTNEITVAFCPRCHQGRLIARYEIVPRRTAYGGMKNG